MISTISIFLLLLTVVSVSIVGAHSNEREWKSGDGSLDYYIENGMGSNIFKLFSQNKDLKNWRLTDEWPPSQGDNNVNSADLRSSYDSAASAMFFDFPYDLYPLDGLTAQYESSVTPYINITVNTNYVSGKVIHTEVRFDTNGDGAFETKALFDTITTIWDPSVNGGIMKEESFNLYSTGYTNGPPGNMNNGLIQVAFWRTDGITDQPGNGIDEDWLTIYCGAYSHWSWVALPYKWLEANPVAVIGPDEDQDPNDWWIETPDDPSSPHYHGYVTNHSIVMHGSDSYSPIGCNITNYQWDFGDDEHSTHSNPNTASGEIVEHTYTYPGVYYIQLIVTDTNLRTGWTDHWIEVFHSPPDNEPPTLIKDNSADSGTTGDSYGFNISAEDDFGIEKVSIYWNHGSIGDNETLTDTNGFWIGKITLNDSLRDLTYITYIHDRSGNLFVSPERIVSITDNDPPELIEEYPIESPETGGETNISVMVSDNIGIESVFLEYSLDAMIFQTENMMPFADKKWSIILDIPTNARDIMCSFILTDVSGLKLKTAETTGGRIIDVLDIISPVAAMEEDLYVDQFEAMTFDGGKCTDNIGISSYVWSFQNGGKEEMLSGREVNYSFEIAGIYNVELTVTDVGGNEDTIHFNLTVRDITPPVAVAGTDMEIDEGGKVPFDGGKSSDDVKVANYSWSFIHSGKEIVLYGMNVHFTFLDPGTYNVSLTVTDEAGNQGIGFLLVRVKDTKQPHINISVDGTRIDDNDIIRIKKGDTVTLDGTNSADNVGVTNYTWIIESPDGTMKFHREKLNYRFDEKYTYKVTLTVFDEDRNSASGTFSIKVTEDGSTDIDQRDDTGFPLWLIVVMATTVIFIIVLAAVILVKKRLG